MLNFNLKQPGHVFIVLKHEIFGKSKHMRLNFRKSRMESARSNSLLISVNYTNRNNVIIQLRKEGGARYVY